MDNAARPSAHPLLGFVRHIVTYETMRARHRGRDRSPNSTLALLSVDARLTPAENVWRPASITDRRDICLLAYPGRRVLEGKQKSRSPEEPRRLKRLGRSFSPVTANTPGRLHDSR